jgi:imidazolonepropionase
VENSTLVIHSMVEEGLPKPPSSDDSVNSGYPGADLGIVRRAAFVVEDGRIAWVGSAHAAPAADERIDADGRAVVPGFVDSHCHLVFAGDRAAEFEARMTGAPYLAGGIRGTVAATRAADDRALRATARRLVAEMARQGTTTVSP